MKDLKEYILGRIPAIFVAVGVLLLLALISTVPNRNINDWVIEHGVVLDYKGTDRNVKIPNAAKVIWLSPTDNKPFDNIVGLEGIEAIRPHTALVRDAEKNLELVSKVPMHKDASSNFREEFDAYDGKTVGAWMPAYAIEYFADNPVAIIVDGINYGMLYNYDRNCADIKGAFIEYSHQELSMKELLASNRSYRAELLRGNDGKVNCISFLSDTFYVRNGMLRCVACTGTGVKDGKVCNCVMEVVGYSPESTDLTKLITKYGLFDGVIVTGDAAYNIILQAWNKPISIIMNGIVFNAALDEKDDIKTVNGVTEYRDYVIELDKFNYGYRITFVQGSRGNYTGLIFTGVTDITNTENVVRYDGGMPTMW